MQVTDSVGSVSGFVSHLGGSVCPEHSSSNWDVTVVNRAVLSQIVNFDQIPNTEDIWGLKMCQILKKYPVLWKMNEYEDGINTIHSQLFE